MISSIEIFHQEIQEKITQSDLKVFFNKLKNPVAEKDAILLSSDETNFDEYEKVNSRNDGVVSLTI